MGEYDAVDRVLAELDGAFAHVDAPAPATLSRRLDGKLYNFDSSGGLARAVQRAFSVAHWRDISLDDLSQLQMVLRTLGFPAITFLLPAYLSHFVRGYLKPESVPRAVLHLLTPHLPTSAAPSERFSRSLRESLRVLHNAEQPATDEKLLWYNSMTPAMKQAIARSLVLVSESPVRTDELADWCAQARGQYWDRFL